MTATLTLRDGNDTHHGDPMRLSPHPSGIAAGREWHLTVEFVESGEAA